MQTGRRHHGLSAIRGVALATTAIAGIAFGSPTITADAVKPIWDLRSSLTSVNIKGKLGAAAGSRKN